MALDSDPAPAAEADPAAATAPDEAPGVIASKQVAVRPAPMAGATTGDALPPKPHVVSAALSPRISWQTTVTASATSVWPTQYITVTTTANADVGPTPYYIRIYENTTPPNILATCGSGTTCSVSLTKPNITGTVVVGTIVDGAGTSLLGEPPDVFLNWHGGSPSVSVSPTTLAVGASSTVTATTTSDVGPSPFYIEIFDTTTATMVKECPSGTSCVAPVSQAAASTHGYQVFLSPLSTTFPPPGSIESTNQVYATWSNAGFTITLNDPRVTGIGTPLTVSATTNLNVGPTPYFIEIYDSTTGTRIASCGAGTTCTGQFQPPGCGPNPDRVVAFVASSSATFLPPNIQAASLVDWACSQPPG
ncbi:MAG TPA: hypothetical protein VH165_08315 [Kofleriaceae bacterium]|nr:hypothetical protein [Kofleriaceae bacterium]